MTFVHRHLDIDPGTPIEQLPLDALDDLLDRGDLGDWSALAAAVRRDPFGPTAERVLRICRAHDMYGTSRLWLQYVQQAREKNGEGGR